MRGLEKNKIQKSTSKNSRRNEQLLPTELVAITPEGIVKTIGQKITEKLSHNKNEKIRPNFSAIRIPDAELPLSEIDEHSLLISFARIILPVGIGDKAKADKCACVMIDDAKKQIFWSSNNRLENFHQEVEYVVEIFRQLANKQECCDKWSRRELLRRAILKDAGNFKTKTFRDYKISFPECTYLWNEFKAGFQRFQLTKEIEFYNQKKREIEESDLGDHGRENKKKIEEIGTKIRYLEEKVSAEENKSEFKKLPEKEEDLTKFLLERRCELLFHILKKISHMHNNDQEKIRKELHSLPSAIFKPLLNVSDLLIIAQQINENSHWWQRMAALLNSRGSLQPQASLRRTSAAVGITQQEGFQVVKGEKEMHAEMKMLEAFSNQEWEKWGNSSLQLNVANSKDNLCGFVEKASNNKQFAVTKRFCLVCDLTLTACEITSKEINSEKTNRMGKKNFFPLGKKEKSKSNIKTANRPSGMLFGKWQAPGIRNEELALKIRKNLNELVDSKGYLGGLTKGGPRRSSVENFSIEEQAVHANLEREKESLLESWFFGTEIEIKTEKDDLYQVQQS